MLGLQFLRDAMALLAPVLGNQPLTTTLVLLGATALVAVAVVLVSRGAVVVATTPAGVCPTREAAEIVPLVRQRDPDASGRVRPRAPGLVLG